MKSFYRLLGAVLLVATTNNFVWFALTYWIYLGTRSVISTGFLGGIYLVVTALSGFWLGGLVDHNKKKRVMLWSSLMTLILFVFGFVIYNLTPTIAFSSVNSLTLWIFVLIVMGGVISGNVYGIAVPTLVTILVPEDKRDKANGLLGTIMGVSFAVTSVASGLVLAFGGLFWVLLGAVGLTSIAIIYLLLLDIPEKELIHIDGEKPSLDIKGTIRIVKKIPGLFALIFFTTFNNFLGGVFFALMDAYGLTLVSVQVWGLLWGFLSLGFIMGGMIIARRGLGLNPLRTLLRINMATWTVCIFFTIQPSIVLLAIGSFIWMTLFPFIEAIEQTIIQKVVPPERQGRVFGVAHSIEQAASPLTAFLIGPITQLIFIPFMTTGPGVDLIGGWYGVGNGRGIALVFSLAGMIGLLVTILATRSKAYKDLSAKYLE